MQHSEFVHLHVHSEYSLLDGAAQLEKLVQRAKDLRFPAIALTDHGNLFGAIDFYLAAQKAGVKPIVGCELYVAPGSRRERGSQDGGYEGADHLTVPPRSPPRRARGLRPPQDAATRGRNHPPALGGNPPGTRTPVRPASKRTPKGFC